MTPPLLLSLMDSRNKLALTAGWLAIAAIVHSRLRFIGLEMPHYVLRVVEVE